MMRHGAESKRTKYNLDSTVPDEPDSTVPMQSEGTSDPSDERTDNNEPDSTVSDEPDSTVPMQSEGGMVRHNISEAEVLSLLHLVPRDVGESNITDIAAILKRFGYKTPWDEWTSTELASQEKAIEVWEASNAEYCEQNLNAIR
jgi:hypothetical protein